MSRFLGRQDCIESLRKDLVDLQGVILDVFSRTGPVRSPSWKFPDKLSCDLDLVTLLDQYDFLDGEKEFNQHSHIVLLELMVDRLMLLLQSFNAYAQHQRRGHGDTQQRASMSLGLVVRYCWSNIVQLGNLKETFRDVKKATKTKKLARDRISLDNDRRRSRADGGQHLSTGSGDRMSTTTAASLSAAKPPTLQIHHRTATASPASPLMSSMSDLCTSALSSVSSFMFETQNHSNIALTSPTLNVLSPGTRNVTCQTVESSLVPCDACGEVQSVLRRTGGALVELCRSEGLSSSLQQLSVAVEDALELGPLTAADIAQWAKEQRRDMGRLGKHLKEVRGTVQPLKERLAAAETERKISKPKIERAERELRQEIENHKASTLRLEQALQEAQKSSNETKLRLQEEQRQLRRGTLSLEESNCRLKEELAVQHTKLHALDEQGNIELQEKVKTLQIEEEARCKLKERAQLLESSIFETELLLDKERAKYHSACRQQESMQAKQRSLIERVDALDQEREELQGKLGESKETQTELQDELKHISQEKQQLLVQIAQQTLWSELQREKQRLEATAGEMKTSETLLREEVEDLSQRERLLVAFPELSPLAHAQAQSTGNVLLDMEQQLQANCIRISVLEQENTILHRGLVRLRERAQDNATKETYAEQTQCLPLTSPSVQEQQNHMPLTPTSTLQSSSAEQLDYGRRRSRADGGKNLSTGSGDRVSTITATSLSAAKPPNLQIHYRTATASPASPLMSSMSDLCTSALSSVSSFMFETQNHTNIAPTIPTRKVLSPGTRNVTCQTVESSLVPCRACGEVQSVLRQMGGALVELCHNEGLSSLQQLSVAVKDALKLGPLTATDIAQWANEQRRDMGRLGKHLQEVRGLVQSLKERLVVAETEGKRSKPKMERAQRELRQEIANHQASKLRLERALQEAQKSSKETKLRLQDEQRQFRRGTLSLEESNCRLKEELAVQHAKLHALVERGKIELQEKVKTLQIEEEAWRKLEEQTQQLESSISETQLLLDKECAKYRSACRQRESMQAKQKSLLERVDALDQEREELQGQLGESEERQTELQDELKHMSQEKEQLLVQIAQQQTLCLELQLEKQRLEAAAGEMKTSEAQLRKEVEALIQREKLLVALPEPSPLAQAQAQSTGNVLLDMEQQLQANSIQISILEQENAILHRGLVRLRESIEDNPTKETSAEQTECLPRTSTPVHEQPNHMPLTPMSPLQSSSAEQLDYGRRRSRVDMSTGSGDCVSTITATSLSAAKPPTLQIHYRTLHLNKGSRADETNAKTRNAFLQSRSRRNKMNRRKPDIAFK